MWPGQGLGSSKSRAGPCKPSTAIPWAPPMHRVPRPGGLTWNRERAGVGMPGPGGRKESLSHIGGRRGGGKQRGFPRTGQQR